MDFQNFRLIWYDNPRPYSYAYPWTQLLIVDHPILRMREETLKSLVHLVDRLQEKQLQEQLVKCVCTLQADPEAAIRTNATIFLGRIAPKLKEAVRWSATVTIDRLSCRVTPFQVCSCCVVPRITCTAEEMLRSVMTIWLDGWKSKCLFADGWKGNS